MTDASLIECAHRLQYFSPFDVALSCAVEQVQLQNESPARRAHLLHVRWSRKSKERVRLNFEPTSIGTWPCSLQCQRLRGISGGLTFFQFRFCCYHLILQQCSTASAAVPVAGPMLAAASSCSQGLTTQHAICAASTSHDVQAMLSAQLHWNRSRLISARTGSLQICLRRELTMCWPSWRSGSARQSTTARGRSGRWCGQCSAHGGWPTLSRRCR